jgi:hypothetical protein
MIESWMRNGGFFGALAAAVGLGLAADAGAVAWTPTVDNSPDLHTTQLELAVELKAPVPATVTVDLAAMGQSTWRTTVPTQGHARVTAVLAPGDFQCVNPGKTLEPLRLGYTTGIEVKDAQAAALTVKWLNRDTTVFPWETEPAPVTLDGAAWWPGLHRNNAGHFGWRYEPNGLLVDNVSFDALRRDFSRKRDNPSESFQFNFGIPGALPPDRTLIEKGDEAVSGKTGLARRQEYQVDKGVYQHDTVEVDWTSFRWQRPVTTRDGKTYRQELRYSTLGIGVQVETDAPAFALSFQSAGQPRCPAGLVLMTKNGARVVTPAEFKPAMMRDNWLLLLAGDGMPEAPVLVVFQKRPDRLTAAPEQLVIHHAGGVGTLALGSPLGVWPLPATTLAEWAQTPERIPVAVLRRGMELLTGYAWKCREFYHVADGWVAIRDQFEFLPWRDDWRTRVTRHAPVPPLVGYAVQKGYLPKSCIAGLADLGVATKWGPYYAQPGSEVTWRLPVPDAWDYFPLQVPPEPGLEFLAKRLADSASPAAVRKLAEPKVEPTIYPHNYSHDFTAGGWRTANYLSPKARQDLRAITRRRVEGSLFPQDYRLRQDPLSGARYLACTFVWEGKDTVNGDGFADIDYWQGLTLYGQYTQAKYNADWPLLAKHWKRVRSLLSYWEATNSWALMSPGARESGDMFHGDMPTGGYAGLVGFHYLADRLGSPYERDLGAYLLARAAVPMVCKAGFRAYAVAMAHQEAGPLLPSSGFGECFVASFPTINPALKGYEPGDPWWLSGCIGPQSAQPEILDLYLKGCPADMLQFERAFMQVCPDELFKGHDDIRVIPHVMLRTYLDGDLRPSTVALLRQYPGGGMLRDTHAMANLLSWDCPVRLVEWAPAYVDRAAWDGQRRAEIALDSPAAAPDLRLWLRGDAGRYTVRVDGQPVIPVAAGQGLDGVLVRVPVPAGRHTVTVEVTKTDDVGNPLLRKGGSQTLRY